MTQANNSVTVTPGVGETIATQAAGGKEYQVVVIADQTGNMDPAFPVTDNGGSLTVDGTVTANAGTGPWPVTDNGGSLTVDGTVTANAGTGNFLSKPYTPSTSDILSGSANAGPSSTTAVTILTVPAGRTWVGSVAVESVYTANAAAPRARAMIQVNGTGVTPAAGTNLCVAVGHATGQTGTGFDAMVPLTYVVAPGGNSVTIQVKLDVSNADFEATGYANGVLL